jgi:hypothetical protein
MVSFSSTASSAKNASESLLLRHVVASCISLATTFYALHQKSSRAHFAAPPFQIEPAALGFDLGTASLV